MELLYTDVPSPWLYESKKNLNAWMCGCSRGSNICCSWNTTELSQFFQVALQIKKKKCKNNLHLFKIVIYTLLL